MRLGLHQDLHTEVPLEARERAAGRHILQSTTCMQATEALQELDLDGDGKVSQAEWLAGMTAATEHVSQATFADVSRALWHCSLETCDTAPGTAPAEPLNSVEYVRRTLARHLHGGLAALCARIAEEHTAVASQRLWDADGHLSEGYRPFNATRWLGEWLQAHNEYKEAVVDDPRTLDWTAGVPWAQLSLDRQLQLAFHHLDEHESGYAPCAHSKRRCLHDALEAAQHHRLGAVQVCGVAAGAGHGGIVPSG